jgi:5-methylcytosine-specific restriction endonuclease McrA
MKRRKPLKRRATDTVSKLKQHLWQLCRQIIIQRHGSDCYTCGARNLSGSNRHLGHFIPSSICSAELRYSLDNLRVCCYRCNIHLSGNWPAYEDHLRRDGIDPEELKRRNRETTGRKYDQIFYQEKIKEYEALLAEETA